MFRILSGSTLLALAVIGASGCSNSEHDAAATQPGGSPTVRLASSKAIASPSVTAPDPEQNSQKAINHPARPVLVAHQGQYFTWATPAGWQSNENANGVDMKSEDGKMTANSVLLVGNRGQTEPWNFLSRMLPMVGVKNLKQVSAVALPSLPSGYPGIKWQIKSFETMYTDASGVAKLGEFTVGICNAYGGYSAIIQSFATDIGAYTQAKTWLPVVAGSVKAVDPGKIAGQQFVLPARNHPLDNSGLIESWKQKSLSEARISQAQREGMMGYERMRSDSGKLYNMPLETYDGTVSGYHNPDQPSEILKKAQPGD